MNEQGVKTYVELPDGAVPLGVVEVCDYLDSEGRTCYGFRFPGEMSYAHALGLLELVKASLVKRYLDDCPPAFD